MKKVQRQILENQLAIMEALNYLMMPQRPKQKEYWLNEAMNSETMKTLAETAKNAKATATAINALVNSLCREERYLVDWCERCNRTATHQLSWCVTVISKAKEEMKMAGMYNNNNRQKC